MIEILTIDDRLQTCKLSIETETEILEKFKIPFIFILFFEISQVICYLKWKPPNWFIWQKWIETLDENFREIKNIERDLFRQFTAFRKSKRIDKFSKN